MYFKATPQVYQQAIHNKVLTTAGTDDAADIISISRTPLMRFNKLSEPSNKYYTTIRFELINNNLHPLPCLLNQVYRIGEKLFIISCREIFR